MQTTRSIFIAAAALAALLGCQDERPSVSLEQARTITATFEGQSFVPPPRTITDVTAILDAQKRTDPIAARELEKFLDSPPPAGGGRRELAHFYQDRGETAKRQGRTGKRRRSFAPVTATI